MPRPLPPPITLTDAAKARVRTLLAGKPEVAGLRIGLKTTGCSGMSYCVNLADRIEPGDAVVDLGDVKVLVEGKAEMFLLGSTMDYVETTLKSGFEFSNPNEAGRCGCGESFTPKS
jgi:iron-sulfur cluster assembly protein